LGLLSGPQQARAQGGTGRSTTSSTAKPKTSSAKVRTRSTSTTAEPDESSATLEETLKWIGEKLANLNSYESISIGDYNPSLKYLEINEQPGSPSYRIDGCTVTRERTFTFRNNAPGHQTVTIPFADTNPRTIKRDFSDNSLTMRANSAIFETYLTDSSPPRQSSPQIEFKFYSAESLKSFESAVRHAVKLC